MNDKINNADNLADIVGMNAILEPASLAPLTIIVLTILITTALLFVYYQFMHGFKGQLRHVKYQLNHTLILPREAAHKIAVLLKDISLTEMQFNTLKALRFAPENPTTQQIIEFLKHVK